MKIGIATFSTEETLSPARLAREVEDRGFESFFLTDHTHFPTWRAPSHPKAYGGGVLPDYYKRTYDPFVGLSFAAAATTRLRVGTAVCLVAERDPIVTAKEVASLDVLSGGRLAAFGVGFGWNRDELEAHGGDFKNRREVVRDRVQLMRRLWTDEVASYEGEHAHLAPSFAWPKPTTSPRIYLGAVGPKAMRHAAEWADVWYPPIIPDYPTLEQRIQEFWRIVDELDRDPDTIGIAFASVGRGDLQWLDRMREHQPERVVLLLEPQTPDRQLRELDDFARLIPEFA